MEKTVSHNVVLPCAVQCLLGSLDICFIEIFCCQATKIKLVTAKVWRKGGPKMGPFYGPRNGPAKINIYIYFWGHETAPKVAPLTVQRGAETDASSKVRDTVRKELCGSMSLRKSGYLFH